MAAEASPPALLVLRDVRGVAAADAARAPQREPSLAAVLAENRELRAEVLALRRLIRFATRGEDPDDGDPALEVIDASSAREFEAIVAARAAALAAAAQPVQGAAGAAAVAAVKPSAISPMRRRAVAVALMLLVAAGLITLIVWGASRKGCAAEESCQQSEGFYYR